MSETPESVKAALRTACEAFGGDEPPDPLGGKSWDELRARIRELEADAAHIADLERKVAVLQAEVRASRAAFKTEPARYIRLVDNPKAGLFGGQLTDAMIQARAETDAQGALT